MSVVVHHGRYVTDEDNYRAKVHRLLVDDPYSPVVRHDRDGACCKVEAWAITQKTITRIITDDAATKWESPTRLVAPGARYLWSDA